MRIVSLGEIEQALDKAAALAAIEEGFRRFSAGEVQLSAVGHLGFEFWNWPILNTDLVSEIGSRLGHRVVVTRGNV